MRKEDESFIFFLQTVVEMEPRQAPPVTMGVLMDRLLLRFEKGESIKFIDKKQASFRIHDMEIDKKKEVAHLLIHYYDKRASDPVFGELDSGKLRKESKLEGEGIAVSAHLTVSLVPIKPRSFIYSTFLEEAPGVGRSRLSSFLRSEIKVVSDDTYKESGVIKKCRPSILMTGIMAKGLEEDLEDGTFRGITLVKNQVDDFMDEDSVMTTIKKQIVLKVSKGLKKGKYDPIAAVKSIFKQAKEKGYHDMVVHYTHSSKRSKSVSVDMKIKDAMDVVFTRLEPVKLEEPMAQCEPKINSEIKEKMLSLLIRSRKVKKKEDEEEETFEKEMIESV